jgi:hypothetical protein
MEVRIITTKKQLYVGLVCFPILIFLSCLTIIDTPHLFVKVINLIVIVALSCGLGAFIREIFVLKEKERTKKL